MHVHFPIPLAYTMIHTNWINSSSLFLFQNDFNISRSDVVCGFCNNYQCQVIPDTIASSAWCYSSALLNQSSIRADSSSWSLAETFQNTILPFFVRKWNRSLLLTVLFKVLVHKKVQYSNQISIVLKSLNLFQFISLTTLFWWLNCEQIWTWFQITSQEQFVKIILKRIFCVET